MTVIQALIFLLRFYPTCYKISLWCSALFYGIEIMFRLRPFHLLPTGTDDGIHSGHSAVRGKIGDGFLRHPDPGRLSGIGRAEDFGLDPGPKRPQPRRPL